MAGLCDIYLAVPRGFCAGVKGQFLWWKRPWKITAHRFTCGMKSSTTGTWLENLRQRGVVFIEDFDEIKDDSRPVILSAHGVPKAVETEAARRKLTVIDATCPLVAKVHRQIRKLAEEGREIVVIGKKEHPEIIGTVGQVDCQDRVHIINSVNEALTLNLPSGCKAGVVTQTTLAVDDAEYITACLRRKFNELAEQKGSDICYATTFRQKAVREIAAKADGVIVIGSKTPPTANICNRLPCKNGAAKAWLIDDADELPWPELENLNSLGISAGASAPEYLVDEVIAELKNIIRILRFMIL
ncbi:MAG: 4-hydroxy-3-methylbut-2-enyl diphosphate reductase [Alphaproteobacteria bacterium]